MHRARSYHVKIIADNLKKELSNEEVVYVGYERCFGGLLLVDPSGSHANLPEHLKLPLIEREPSA